VSAVCSPAYIAPTVQHLPDVLERVQLLQWSVIWVHPAYSLFACTHDHSPNLKA
jgi:hypothetical protein